MKPTIYVVTMHKWGWNDSHSYVLGVWTKKFQAMKAADTEETNRGGKYSAEITKRIINSHHWTSGQLIIGRAEHEDFNEMEYLKRKSRGI